MSTILKVIASLGMVAAMPVHANAVRSDIEKNIFGCYDTVIFNNSGASIRGGRIDWRYDYADGGYNQGSNPIPSIGAGQRMNIGTYGASDMNRCKTVRYTFKVLNWQTY